MYVYMYVCKYVYTEFRMYLEPQISAVTYLNPESQKYSYTSILPGILYRSCTLSHSTGK
jgi:hypothetical protein